jgi:hypothetical protein
MKNSVLLPLNWVVDSKDLSHYDVLIAPFLQPNGRIKPEHRKKLGIKRQSQRAKPELYQRYQKQWLKDKNHSKSFPLWIFERQDLSNSAKRAALVIKDFYHPKMEGNLIELEARFIAKFYGENISKPTYNQRRHAQEYVNKAFGELASNAIIEWDYDQLNVGQKNEMRWFYITIAEGWHMSAPNSGSESAHNSGPVSSYQLTKPLFFQKSLLPPVEETCSASSPSLEETIAGNIPAPVEQGGAGELAAISSRMTFLFLLINRNIEEMRKEGSSIPSILSKNFFVKALYEDNIARIENMSSEVFEEFCSHLKEGRICSPRLMRDRMDSYIERSIREVSARKQRIIDAAENRSSTERALKEMLGNISLRIEEKLSADPLTNLASILPNCLLDEYVEMRGSMKPGSRVDSMVIAANEYMMKKVKEMSNV